MNPDMPSTLPPCPVASGIIRRVAAAGPDYVERAWSMSDQEMQTIRDLSARFFAEGFAVSREGFNAESMSKCGPDGLSLSQLSDATIDCILEDENISGNASLDGLQWIPVSERLPEDGDRVLFYNAGDEHKYARMVRVGRCIDDGPTGHMELRIVDFAAPSAIATHWMPLPEPPAA